MPALAFQHTHVLVVILFLILFIVKAFLLFLNKHETLKKVRNKTKVLDMVFGILIVVTGGYLLSLYDGIPGWLWVKIILVFAAIPLGIIGLKRHNKMLTALTVMLFIYVYGVAETHNLTMTPNFEESSLTATDVTEDIALDELDNIDSAQIVEPPVTTSVATPTDDEAVNKMAGGSSRDIVEANAIVSLDNARAIYTQLCQECHGADGAKKLSGASVLNQSRLSQEQQKQVIANGRGLMQPYKDQLTDQEMEALAAYTIRFKQN